MAHEVRMPQLAQSVVEGEVARWLVQEGDAVRLEQPLVEIITDKVNVELPSPSEGVVLKIAVAEGRTVPIGTPLLYIGLPGETWEAGATPATQVYSSLTSSLMAARRDEADRAGQADAGGPVVGGGPTPPAPPASTAETAGAVRATPLVRKLAQEHGVDLATLAGTGAEGRITREDVLRAAPVTPAAPAAAPRPVEYRPFSGRRKQIAQHLVRAKQTAPHASCMDEVDVTHLVRLYAEQKDAASAAGVRLTYLAYFVRAAALALVDHPLLNSTLEEDHGRIAVKRYYNIGVAVDAPDGLIVPVVHQAEALGLVEVAARIQALAARAREGRLEPAEVQDSTFSVSNVGGDGGLLSVGIINYPEVALLTTHRIEQRPAVVGGEIVIRDRMYLTLTFDHRVIDGVEAVRFLGDVRRRLEQPREWALV